MLKKSQDSSLQRLALWLLCILLVIITGCQQRNEIIAGWKFPYCQND